MTKEIVLPSKWKKMYEDVLGDLVFNTTIPRNVRLSEAPSYGQAVISYDHKCSGSIAYIELTKRNIR